MGVRWGFACCEPHSTRRTPLVIFAIHTTVPGRARYRVEGLFRSDSLKRLLEVHLPRRREILRVRASTATGNILVHYDSGQDHQSIAALIETLLKEPRGTNGTPTPEESAPREAEPPSPEPAVSMPVDPAWLTVASRLAPSPTREAKPWHLLPEEEVLALVGSHPKAGLSQPLALARLDELGANALPETRGRSGWEMLLGQFTSLPVLLLAGAAGLSLFTGGILDATIILGVVVANALIGYATERSAEKTIRSLRQSIRPEARVLRDGRTRKVPAEEIVVGDMLLLDPGSQVAADCRVLEASHLSIDESALTGESMPVFKHPGALERRDLPLGDRLNMAYTGTVVTGGAGLGVVVATGSGTEIGKLQALLDETSTPQTPIERQLAQTGNQLVLLGTAVCGVVFVIGALRGYGLLQMARNAISLAAAAVPEGLPAAATITFSLGIRNMREHQVLIRQLHAVETLGAVQTVCLDKTGTITWNRMSVLEVHAGGRRYKIRGGAFLLDGQPVDPVGVEELERLLLCCVLCNETRIDGSDGNGGYELIGSPTENALIELAATAGVDAPRVREEHRRLKLSLRAENRLYMKSLHACPDGGRLLAVKGSPQEVLGLCTWAVQGGKRVRLTDQRRLAIETENDRMAGEALRVLGVAYAIPEGQSKTRKKPSLTWLGLVGMADPIREGVGDLIEVLHRAGIETVMITGDQSATAHAVADELKLSQGEPLEILDSSEITGVEPEMLEALAKRAHVYARVSPSHKLRIVQALQATGKTVAMTGDGVNDGPALKAANIGIAMGSGGTDIAREVADVVLEKDNLETLIVALRDGRTTYHNIRKSVHFFLSTNMSEIMVMFAAMATGIGFPLNAMQLLWINLISDIFPGLALSLEQVEGDVLDQPPRDPKAPLFSRGDYKRMALESAFISAGALGAYGFGISRFGMGARAQSLAFHGLTVGQLLHALSCRSERHRLLDKNQPAFNTYLSVALGGSLGLQALTNLVPGLRRLLGLTPLGLVDLVAVAASAVVPLALNELTKTWKQVEGDADQGDDDL